MNTVTVQLSGRGSLTLDQESETKKARRDPINTEQQASVAPPLFRNHLLRESASVMSGLVCLINSDSTPSHPRYPRCTAAWPSHVSHRV